MPTVVARDVLAPGTPELEAVYRRFGDDAAPGATGRWTGPPSGGSCSPIRRPSRDLEAIVHPAVRPRILAALVDAAAEPAPVAVVVEAIKLVEGGLADLCDEVWLVTCDPDVQRERLIGRGDDAGGRRGHGSRPRATSPSGLRPRATRVLDTSGTAEDRRRDDASRRAPRGGGAQRGLSPRA